MKVPQAVCMFFGSLFTNYMYPSPAGRSLQGKITLDERLWWAGDLYQFIRFGTFLLFLYLSLRVTFVYLRKLNSYQIVYNGLLGCAAALLIVLNVES